jgi:hypothetical protein
MINPLPEYLDMIQEDKYDTFRKGVKDFGSMGSKPYPHSFEDTITRMSIEYLGYTPKQILTTAAAAAAIIIISYKIYKHYMTKAAKACKGHKGEDKKVCMDKYKKDALKKRLNALMKGYAKCPKSKNPITCKSKIEKEIKKIKDRLEKLTKKRD